MKQKKNKTSRFELRIDADTDREFGRNAEALGHSKSNLISLLMQAFNHYYEETNGVIVFPLAFKTCIDTINWQEQADAITYLKVKCEQLFNQIEQGGIRA